jgi:hypothetical protein
LFYRVKEVQGQEEVDGFRWEEEWKMYNMLYGVEGVWRQHMEVGDHTKRSSTNDSKVHILLSNYIFILQVSLCILHFFWFFVLGIFHDNWAIIKAVSATLPCGVFRSLSGL